MEKVKRLVMRSELRGQLGAGLGASIHRAHLEPSQHEICIADVARGLFLPFAVYMYCSLLFCDSHACDRSAMQ